MFPPIILTFYTPHIPPLPPILSNISVLNLSLSSLRDCLKSLLNMWLRECLIYLLNMSSCDCPIYLLIMPSRDLTLCPDLITYLC